MPPHSKDRTTTVCSEGQEDNTQQQAHTNTRSLKLTPLPGVFRGALHLRSGLQPHPLLPIVANHYPPSDLVYLLNGNPIYLLPAYRIMVLELIFGLSI
jgi:hypothetical protein